MFDSKKSRYLDDEEWKGIRDLEHLFKEINENDIDYYKSILVEKNKTLSIKQYLNKIILYLKKL